MTNPSPLAKAFMEQGKSEPCPVIDMHGHFGPVQGIYFPNVTAEAMIGTMDRAGVRMIVCSHHAALVDPQRGNPQMAEVVARYPDRFRAYWALNPNYPDRLKRQVKAYPNWNKDRKTFVGFKFLSDYHKVAITDDRYKPALEYAQAHRMMILMHTWGHSEYDGPALVEKVAQRYPDVTFLMGHSGYGEWDRAIGVARDYENVYLELTAAYHVNGIIERMVREAGSHKILFGTDLPWFDPHYGIGCVVWAKIADEDRHNILHRNAERLLRAQGVEVHMEETGTTNKHE